ncbi:MAG: hypothetical protein HDR88_03820 [Bacteroides sp.]|nr:hypothetical protein [Bacteroides sp.]
MADRRFNFLILEDSYYTRCDVAEHVRKIRPESDRILISESIQEACEVFEHENIDLVIADTTVCDGETIDFFLEYNLTVPVVFYSGYDCEEDYLRNLNIVDYLKLPVTFDALKESFRKFDLLISK